MVSGKREESIEIKQDDKFFTRIMSKETSTANSSHGVYYGGASGAIPFMWESRPGTPKHILANSSNIPPLTPPPSYYSTSTPKSKHYGKSLIKPNFLRASLFPTSLMAPKRTNHSPSSSTSSTNSSLSSYSSWSSIYSSPSNLKDTNFQKRLFFTCSRSPLRCMIDHDDHEHALGSPTSALRYGAKRRGFNQFHGCYLIGNVKNAFLSIVGHGSR